MIVVSCLLCESVLTFGRKAQRQTQGRGRGDEEDISNEQNHLRLHEWIAHGQFSSRIGRLAEMIWAWLQVEMGSTIPIPGLRIPT